MQDMRQRALTRTCEILAEHFSENIDSEMDSTLRKDLFKTERDTDD